MNDTDDIFTSPELPAEISALSAIVEDKPPTLKQRLRQPFFFILILLIEFALIFLFEDFINKPPIRLAEKEPAVDVTLLPQLPPELKMPPPPPPPPPPAEQKLERMQSEKPKVAKKAEENKLFAKLVPQSGTFMAAKKKEDNSVSARVGSEAQDGVDSGIYSEFLHQWVENVKALYPNPVVNEAIEESCGLAFQVQYNNGHVEEIQPADSCGNPSDQAFYNAIRQAARPPMPTSFANQHITFIFYGPGVTRR